MTNAGTVILLLLLFSNTLLYAQSTTLEEMFEPLVGKTWTAEGNWENGGAFKQVATFSFDLDRKIVKVESEGYTNQEQTQFGPRNHGIRQFDTASNTIRFWEFDVFGGVTTGKVWADGDDIYYQYEYGGSIVTDAWLKVDDHTYDYKVGFFIDRKWTKELLSTQFKADPDVPNLAHYLPGKWVTKAWDGELQETWEVGVDGHLHQSALYIENQDTLYRSHSKIEKIDGQPILFSVIANNPAKIFQSTAVAHNQVVFENSEYKNPNKVIYEFLPDGTFHRTISGKENGEPTSYTFKFKKVN